MAPLKPTKVHLSWRLALAKVHWEREELRTETEPPSPLLVAGPHTSSFLTLWHGTWKVTSSEGKKAVSQNC